MDVSWLAKDRGIVPTPVGVNRDGGGFDTPPHHIVPTPVGVNRLFMNALSDAFKLSPRPWG